MGNLNMFHLKGFHKKLFASEITFIPVFEILLNKGPIGK